MTKIEYITSTTTNRCIENNYDYGIILFGVQKRNWKVKINHLKPIKKQNKDELLDYEKTLGKGKHIDIRI